MWCTPFWFGCIAGIAGIVPWIALFDYLLALGSDMPSFAFGIFATTCSASVCP